jgi:hypothetical protein
LGHFAKGGFHGLHLVTQALHGLALRQQDRRCGLALAVVAHAPGQAVQRQAHAAQHEPPRQQRGQQARHGRCGHALPDVVGAGLCRHLLACGAVKHDVQVTRRPCVARAGANMAALKRRGTGAAAGCMGSVPRSGSGAPARKARTGARSTCGCCTMPGAPM